MKRQARISEGWVKCSQCGHKLFKITDNITDKILENLQEAQIEIKCHSCKALNEVVHNGKKY